MSGITLIGRVVFPCCKGIICGILNRSDPANRTCTSETDPLFLIVSRFSFSSPKGAHKSLNREKLHDCRGIPSKPTHRSPFNQSDFGSDSSLTQGVNLMVTVPNFTFSIRRILACSCLLATSKQIFFSEQVWNLGFDCRLKMM